MDMKPCSKEEEEEDIQEDLIEEQADGKQDDSDFEDFEE